MTISRIARHITTQTKARARKIGRHDSIARLHANLTALADRFNQGTITAGQYLTAVLGADPEFAAAYDSPFGKAIKKAYIAIHDAEPAKLRLVAVGRRLHRKIGYQIGEPALVVAARAYPRTAALAPRTPKPEAPAAIEPAPEPVAAFPAPPKFVVAHTTPGHYEVQGVDPRYNGRSADGIDYTDFDAAKTAANRRNTDALIGA